jgi:hypothetical protein
MCNLYSITTNIALFRVVNRYVAISHRCRGFFPITPRRSLETTSRALNWR